MLRSIIAAAVLCLPLQAQFDGMVTTDDGGIVLFNSPWRLAGSNDGALEKIFRWDTHGFSLIFSPPDNGTAVPPSASAPMITGDGTIFGYVSNPGCAGSGCFNAPPSLMLSGATPPSNLPVALPFQTSRNGRFIAAGLTVVDRSTGSAASAGTGTEPIGGRFGIGNNGGLLILLLHQAFIISTVDLLLSTLPNVTIATSNAFYSAIVSASENRVVYEIAISSSSTERQLWSYEVASGQSTMLADYDFQTFIGVSQFQPSISNDGSRVLYRMINTETGASEAVVHDFTNGSTTVLGAMLVSNNNFDIAGDGKSAWLHQADGQLAHVEIDTLQASVVPGRHAWIAQKDGAPVFGSFNHLYGGGFAPDDNSPPPSDLSLNAAGLSFPILHATTRELDMQIPWELFITGQFPLVLHSSTSPFESIIPLDLTDLAPTFERTGMPSDTNERSLIVAHEDFHGLVTSSDPAAPGEIVHFYLTGLGDVQPRPLTGSPPAALAYANQRPVCFLIAPFAPDEVAPVEFAGLAPTLIGIYQMDVMIPADYPTSLTTISCFDIGALGKIVGDSGPLPVKSQ